MIFTAGNRPRVRCVSENIYRFKHIMVISRFKTARLFKAAAHISLMAFAGLLFGAVSSQTNSPGGQTPTYVLGSGDQVRVYQPNAEELDGREVRIDSTGYATFPLLGRVQIGGLTLQAAEALLQYQLTQYLRNPKPVVVVTEYKSQPFEVLGAITNPGTYQLQGEKTLLQAIGQAGGLRPDAGTQIKLTRKLEFGQIPLPGETVDQAANASTVTVDTQALLSGSDPAVNCELRPQDLIYISKADLIYVAGDVHKPGGFPLTRSTMSTLQALTLAEGAQPDASIQHVRVIRKVDGGNRDLPLDARAVMDGKAPDIELQPGDILYVPSSKAKKATLRTTEAIVQAATGLVIWGRL